MDHTIVHHILRSFTGIGNVIACLEIILGQTHYQYQENNREQNRFISVIRGFYNH